MSFIDDIKELRPKVDSILSLLEPLTPQVISSIVTISKVDLTDFDAPILLLRKIEQNQDTLNTVSNGMPYIERVLKIQDNISSVANSRDLIGIVAGSIDQVKITSDNKVTFGAVVAMKPMIDEVLKLSVKIDLVLDIEERMDEVLAVEKRLHKKIEKMTEIEYSITKSSMLTVDMLNKVTIKEQKIDEKLKEIKGYRDEMIDFNIDTEYVSSTQSSASIYIPETNTLILKIREGKTGAKGSPGEDGKRGVPGSVEYKGEDGLQGKQGEPGKSLKIDTMGTISQRKRFGNRPIGTNFLALDKSPAMLYFRKSNMLDDWTDGVPFGSKEGGYAKTSGDTEKFMGMTLAEHTNYIKSKIGV